MPLWNLFNEIVCFIIHVFWTNWTFRYQLFLQLNLFGSLHTAYWNTVRNEFTRNNIFQLIEVSIHIGFNFDFFFFENKKKKIPSVVEDEQYARPRIYIWNQIRASTADTIMCFEFKSLIDVRFILWHLPPENKHPTKTKILFETIGTNRISHWIRIRKLNPFHQSKYCISSATGYRLYIYANCECSILSQVLRIWFIGCKQYTRMPGKVRANYWFSVFC